MFNIHQPKYTCTVSIGYKVGMVRLETREREIQWNRENKEMALYEEWTNALKTNSEANKIMKPI